MTASTKASWSSGVQRMRCLVDAPLGEDVGLIAQEDCREEVGIWSTWGWGAKKFVDDSIT